MPSWPSRFLSASSTPVAPPASTSSNPLAKESNLQTSPSNAYGQPPASPTRLRPKTRQQHSRSFSHPFPSLFGGGKRRNFALDDSSTDDEAIVDDELGSRDHKVLLDEEAQVGNCMACDSKVKWPKSVDTFICATCLTINDRKPITSDEAKLTGKAGTYPGSVPSQQSLPLSVERTIAIVNRCIDTYLCNRLEKAQPCDGNPSTDDRVTQVDHRGPSLPILSAASRELPREKLSKPMRKAPPPPVQLPGKVQSTTSRSPVKGGESPKGAAPTADQLEQKRRHETVKAIFKPLEDYIVANFGNRQCLNASFSTARPEPSGRTFSEGSINRPRPALQDPSLSSPDVFLDNKTLLLGDIAENGTWWAGGRTERERSRRSPSKRGDTVERSGSMVSHRSPRIDWTDLRNWYETVLTAGQRWKDHMSLASGDSESIVDENFREARIHTQRTLLKVSEALLKRPGGVPKRPEDIRFLLILLANPLLYPSFAREKTALSNGQEYQASRGEGNADINGSPKPPSPPSRPHRTSRHSGIVKRILGLLANLTNECHRDLVFWFSRFSEDHLQRVIELVGSFVTHRLSRQQGRKRDIGNGNPAGGLVPDLPGASATASSQLHAALGYSGSTKKADDAKTQLPAYSEDWQLKAASRVMALLFAANSVYRRSTQSQQLHMLCRERAPVNAGTVGGKKAKPGQLLAVSDFYNTLLDYEDLVADFETWEARKGHFCFCQYPFFLSLGAKIRIMEHDARRQMEIKAREAFFHSILTNQSMDQYLVLRIRRECLVEDSLKSISEVVGAGQEEIKKGLRIKFHGEEGVDAGGLRKEWFLLLVRDIFDPNHGMFVYDEDSNFCYFNPNSLETSDQYFLVGALLGLAIYNSTILDVALPPFVFKRLLASAPSSTYPSSSAFLRPAATLTLDDLAEYRPALARGLRDLLTFQGNVAETFCRDFVAEVERYGRIEHVPLCPNGEGRPVTNANRQEFVDLYVKYLLETSVTRQFEPFKRGFFTVCGGNALSLFRAEEIEALVRGSEEELDVAALKAVAAYEGWGARRDVAEDVDMVRWFWEVWEEMRPWEQRKLLGFLTGSDRLPAAGGSAGVVLKIVNGALGEEKKGRVKQVERFPVARTCFNMLVLGRYASKDSLREKLWRAVVESEGFGLK